MESYKKDWRPTTVVERGGVMIGTQYIKVESGGNMYNGSQADYLPMRSCVEEKGGMKCATVQDDLEEMSNIDRVLIVVRKMVEGNEISDKQEFAAIHRIVAERILIDIKRGEFCRLISDNIDIPDSILPSDDNLRKVVFSEKSTYPNWKITGFSFEKVYAYTNIARSFLKHYNG